MNFVKKLKTYKPLIFIVGLILLLVVVRQVLNGYDPTTAMYDFMGITFLVFGFIKMLKWHGFVDAYMSYDVIARHSRLYAYAYPVFEVVLGYLFFMQLYVFYASVATIILTGLSTIGVVNELRKKNPFPCACLGAVFVLPMTWVTLFENLFMMAMAFALIVLHL